MECNFDALHHLETFSFSYVLFLKSLCFNDNNYMCILAYFLFLSWLMTMGPFSKKLFREPFFLVLCLNGGKGMWRVLFSCPALRYRRPSPFRARTSSFPAPEEKISNCRHLIIFPKSFESKNKLRGFLVKNLSGIKYCQIETLPDNAQKNVKLSKNVSNCERIPKTFELRFNMFLSFCGNEI